MATLLPRHYPSSSSEQNLGPTAVHAHTHHHHLTERQALHQSAGASGPELSPSRAYLHTLKGGALGYQSVNDFSLLNTGAQSLNL